MKKEPARNSTRPGKAAENKGGAVKKKAVLRKKTKAAKTPPKKSAAPRKTSTLSKKAVSRGTKRRVSRKTASARKKPISATTIIAKIDVGFGNNLYIRGEGSGLTWEKGILMENVASEEWTLSAKGLDEDVSCKFLINDRIWSSGDNILIKAGEKSVVVPRFQ